jgi:hypothetical protein
MTTPLTDAFRALLEHTETLGLNEGDMLRVNSALQTAFNATDGITTTIKTCTTPIFLFFERSGKRPGMKLVESQETMVCKPRSMEYSYKCIVDVSSDWNAMPVIITRQKFNLISYRVFELFLRLHQPRKVYIETPLGMRRTTFSSYAAEQRLIYKSMKADYKSAGRTDEDIGELLFDSETTCLGEFHSHCSAIVSNSLIHN